uniref:Uncharacterized protein n=1 Tax=Arion vulgaris TaxID=1028688 RepID=A0A0B6ZTM8_9EUPU
MSLSATSSTAFQINFVVCFPVVACNMHSSSLTFLMTYQICTHAALYLDRRDNMKRDFVIPKYYH